MTKNFRLTETAVVRKVPMAARKPEPITSTTINRVTFAYAYAIANHDAARMTFIDNDTIIVWNSREQREAMRGY